MSTDNNRLYVAVGVLAVLGGALYLQQNKAKEEQATYTLEGKTSALPDIGATDEKTNSINRVVIQSPPGDAGAGEEVELKKEGSEWKLVKPVAAKANQANVTSLIGALKTIKMVERIDPSSKNYDQFELSDGKALHATFYNGDKTVFDLYFGQDGSRGQMTRIAGKDGVYAAKGYSSYLFKRDAKGWRDLGLLKFEEDEVKRIDVTNENGSFTFERKVETKAPEKGAAGAPSAPVEVKSWIGKFKKAKAPIALDIQKFEPTKVDDLVRAYKALTATDFAQNKKPEDLGLATPTATVVFQLKDGAQKIIKLGSTGDNSSRWVQVGDSAEIFAISSWAGDWATAAEEKFKKAEPKPADKDAGAATPPPGMPPGMDPHGMGE